MDYEQYVIERQMQEELAAQQLEDSLAKFEESPEYALMCLSWYMEHFIEDLVNKALS